MKRIARWLAGITLWCSLAAIAGSQIGYHQGYTRGVRDIGKLILLWRDGDHPPEPFSSGAI